MHRLPLGINAVTWRDSTSHDRLVLVIASGALDPIDSAAAILLDALAAAGIHVVVLAPEASARVPSSVARTWWTEAKADVVAWVRANLAGAHVVAIGADATDEAVFEVLALGELALAVGRPDERISRARGWLAGDTAVRELLASIVEQRTAHEPALHAPIASRTQLLVVAHRTLPARIAAPLESAMRAFAGVWLGWSGELADGAPALAFAPEAPARAAFPLPPALRDRYATFCDGVLWPLFHSMRGHFRYTDEHWAAYREANALYAAFAARLASPTATIWVHDYQLMLVAEALRAAGHRGPIGMFFHVPFPPRDPFDTLPWAGELLDATRAFDLVGFHADQCADNFNGCMRGARGPLTTVLPFGVDPTDFVVSELELDPEVVALKASLGTRKLVLGVDPLDSAKGVPERLVAFERLLHRHPEWRGAVTFIQVSIPAPAERPEYAELRTQIEKLVGRINGQYGEADWVPVRYLYRSYEDRVLRQLYRIADVALVTPLRDAFSPVAKEFVAAQPDDDPGVLVLSRFASAAAELDAAILTNPYHADGMATDLDRALAMPVAERRARQATLAHALAASSPSRWVASFLDHLDATRTGSG